jgi:hypothetical protein
MSLILILISISYKDSESELLRLQDNIAYKYIILCILIQN